MSPSSDPSPTHGQAARLRLVAAWFSLALVPVAIGMGRAASSAFLDSRGYPQPVSTEPPGLGLVSFGLFATIVLVPTIGAVWFGLSAARKGRRSGRTAAAIAGLIGGGLVALGLPLFLSRLIGWPLVLVIGGVLVAVIAVRRARSGRLSA